MHRDPVKRGLVRSPENWAWNSFRRDISSVEGEVGIESQWTAREREQNWGRRKSKSPPRRRKRDKDGAS